MATLGEGDNVAVLYLRGGQSRIAEIPATVSLQWSRVLDDISEATVQCVIPGDREPDARAECCRVLGNIHTWQHELVIFRSGQRVWEGPIVRVAETGATVTINALDVLGWTNRRAHKGRKVSNVWVANELMAMVQAAFAENDPNVLQYAQLLAPGSGALVDRDVKVNSGYYAEDLDGLGDQGANYTVIGRMIVVWPDRLTLGRVSRIYPGEHLVAEVEIVEDGMLLSTRVAARNDADQSAKSTLGAPVDPYYGLVETITEASGVRGITPLTNVANSVWQASGNAANTASVAPMIVRIPDGSTLTCDAPFDISELVPGVVVPIETRMTCRAVAADQMLTQVQVSQGPDGEEVQITLAPLTASAVQ